MKINYRKGLVAGMFITCATLLNAQSSASISNNASANNQQLEVPPHRTCGTDILPQQFESWLQSVTPPGGSKGSQNLSAESVFNIPVVVHVIHNGEALNSGSNISNAQILSQIAILNKDFNGTNADTNLIPAAFKPMLGKCKINFCLAVVNPTGGIMPEPGVNRINRNTMGWSAPPFSNMTYWNNTIKPQSIWDVNRYLNMWVANIGSSLLGFATFPNPGTSGLPGIPSPYGSTTTDGVVINHTAFGDVGTATAPFNKGRTATHEIGHWLGLRHVWGDSNCGSDFCNDTPTQSNETYNCPSFPTAAGCTGSPNPPGRMFMNFMDYVNDACMYMFTNDQAYRAQLIMVHSPIRAALLTSTVCNLPSVVNDIGIMYVSIPTYSQVINCHNFINPVVIIKNFGSNNISSITFTYNVNGVGTQTLNWTGNLAPNTTATVNIPTIFGIPNGTNGFNISALNPNSTTDSNMSNNYNNQMFVTTNGVNVNTSVAPSATVCAGQQLTLTASGATSYTWNPGNLTGASVTLAPSATTMYTVSATSGTCVTTRTVPITVSPSPTLTVQNQTICTGGTATLIASGASTYSWSTSQTTPTIFVTPASNTTYTITGTVGSCSNTKTVSVTVGPNLGINLAATSTVFCSGGSATITANGASSYTWSTSSNNTSITVSPAVTTTYTVNGTAGACSGSAAITISVNPTPTITSSPNTTICSGSSTILTAGGASTYTWMPGSLTGPNVNVTPASTTIYTVTGTAVGGCVNSKTLSVTVNTKPTVNVASSSATTCPGVAVTLFATGANTYNWNPGNLSGASVSVTPSSTTVYTVVGTALNGCTDTKTLNITVMPCTGLSTQAAANMQVAVYPNPFKEELVVVVGEEVQVSLFNALGQKVRTVVMNGEGKLYTEDLGSGMYFVHVKGQSGTKIFKVTKN